MKVILFFLCLLTSSVTVISQEMVVIKKTDSLPQIKEKGLAFISNESNIEGYYFIAKIKILANDFNLILRQLQRTSIDFNANAFKFISKENLIDKTSLELDLYSVCNDLIESNKKKFETNVIYFFGNDNKSQKFKINNEKIELKPEEIYRYEIPKTGTIKINKGGFVGMTIYHHWIENQSVLFYAFGSGTFSSNGNGYSTIGLSISTGSILELKSDFAQLLIELKKK